MLAGVVPGSTPGPVSIQVDEVTDQDRTYVLDLTLVQAGLAITSFTADLVYVTPGAAVTLKLVGVPGDKVELHWGDGSHGGDASGSWQVEPEETVIATLTAIAGNDTVTAQLTITVATPEIVDYDIEPSFIGGGASCTLSWTTLHAASATLEFHPQGMSTAPEGRTAVPTSDQGYAVQPPCSGTYWLRAVGEGRVVPGSVPVTIEPVVASIAIDPPQVPLYGDSAMLTWNTQWASSVTLNGNPVGASDTRSVQAQGADDVYTLVADGLDPQTLTAELLVASVLTYLKFALVNESTFTLGWTTIGANEVSANVSAPVTQSGNYKEIDAPFGPVQLTVAGGGGPVVIADVVPSGSDPDLTVELTGTPGVNGPGTTRLQATAGSAISATLTWPNEESQLTGGTSVEDTFSAGPGETLTSGVVSDATSQVSWTFNPEGSA